MAQPWYTLSEGRLVRSRFRPIGQDDRRYLIDMMIVREVLPGLIETAAGARSLALSCNLSNWDKGRDHQCTILHRLQFPCLPSPDFSDTFASTRESGRAFLALHSPNPPRPLYIQYLYGFYERNRLSPPPLRTTNFRRPDVTR